MLEQLALQPLVSNRWPEHPNVSIIRGDLIHPIVSGNKLYKLLLLLQEAQALNASCLISVGGRYSNHLHALAWAGKTIGIKTVGLVRGYENQPLTPTLIDCQSWGMTLHFIAHYDYQARHTDAFWRPWLDKYPNGYRIDEGGWSRLALEGSRLWWNAIDRLTELVVCAVGSGSTLGGLILHQPQGVRSIGIPVFRDPNHYQDLKDKLVAEGARSDQIELWGGYAGRGFGKLSSEQRQFKSSFEHNTGINLDPVYTAKLFYGLDMQLKQNPELRQKNIAVIHSGGLQGNRS